jgi:hypothetical protein
VTTISVISKYQCILEMWLQYPWHLNITVCWTCDYNICELYIYICWTGDYSIHDVNRVTNCYTLDIEFLTCGNDNLTYEQNCIIFKYLFDYIKCSKRFLLYSWNWIVWTCISYESILSLFFFLFVNIHHWFVISATYSNACLLCTSLL